MVPLRSECRESKVRYSASWGEKGGKASWIQGLPGVLIPFIDGALANGREGSPNLTFLIASLEKFVEDPKKFPMVV